MSYPQETFVGTTVNPKSFLGRLRKAACDETLLYQLEILKKTGRYDAFKLQWHPIYSETPTVWPVPKHLFWDSDVAKWIEGACYFLREKSHSQIEKAVKELVSMIRSAQQADGYLNIHFTVVEPEKRFTNLRDLHELYNAGHLIEAALAHNQLYGNEDLLGPICKYVDLIAETFGPNENQSHGYPGHPEIELALLRLYERTGNAKHLKLASFFIAERGNPVGSEGTHFYKAEQQARGEGPMMRPSYWPDTDCLWYYQAHKPLVEQKTIEGHSVRAMYLLTAASDLVRTNPESVEGLKEAIYTLWKNMVDKKMYVTGGIGAMTQYEGFGQEYFLPQGSDEGGCYAETCAAIGVMMLAQRILQYDLDRKFSDVMELCLYNAVLTAMSLDGRSFTYVNQLASSDTDLSRREAWFTCACCPPNILRLLGQIGGYIYDQNRSSSTGGTDINVHLFASSSLKLDYQEGSLQQDTNWPWDGKVEFCLSSSFRDVTIRLRIPSWAATWHVSLCLFVLNHLEGC